MFPHTNILTGQDAISFLPQASLQFSKLNNTDIQFVYNPYAKEDDGTASTDGGGDMQIRLKINFWGNDGGDTAFGIIHSLKFQLPRTDWVMTK